MEGWSNLVGLKEVYQTTLKANIAETELRSMPRRPRIPSLLNVEMKSDRVTI